jgi:hypothetical protein
MAIECGEQQWTAGLVTSRFSAARNHIRILGPPVQSP